MRWHFLLILFLVQTRAQSNKDVRHSAQKTKSNSSEDAKFLILFQGEQQNFAGAEILETKAGGRSCLFFYTDSLPRSWDVFVDLWDDREKRRPGSIA